jgi:outer membrane protein TolC
MKTIIAAALFLTLLPAPLPAAGAVELTIVEGSTLTLSRCLAIALAEAPDVKSADFAVLAGRDRMKAARAGWYPSINAAAGYTANKAADKNLSDPFSSKIATYDGKDAGVSVSQILYDFGRTKAAADIGSDSLGLAERGKEVAVLSLATTIKINYYGLLGAQRVREVQKEIVAQYNQQLLVAQSHFAAGTKPKYDVTKAEVDLSSARLQLLQAEHQVQLAWTALNAAMNKLSAPVYYIEDTLDFARMAVTFDAIVAAAYNFNPAIKAQEEVIKLAEHRLLLSRSSYYPVLSGFAGYGYSGSVSPLSRGWNAGIAASLNLFSGFSDSSKTAEAGNLLSADRMKLENIKLLILLQARQAFLSLQNAEDSIESASLQVKQAAENLDIASARYETGLGGPVEMADATVSYGKARQALIQALYDYKRSQTDIEKIMGKNDLR